MRWLLTFNSGTFFMAISFPQLSGHLGVILQFFVALGNIANSENLTSQLQTVTMSSAIVNYRELYI